RSRNRGESGIEPGAGCNEVATLGSQQREPRLGGGAVLTGDLQRGLGFVEVALAKEDLRELGRGDGDVREIERSRDISSEPRLLGSFRPGAALDQERRVVGVTVAG